MYFKKLVSLFVIIFLSSLSQGQECITGDCNDGLGTYLWADGSQYISHFKNGEPYGEAKIIMANGDEVIGNWLEENFYSKGQRTYPDGIYVGEFKNNKRHGQGTYSWFEGGKYIGAWRDDKRHGLGICINENEIHNACEWREGLAHDRMQ